MTDRKIIAFWGTERGNGTSIGVQAVAAIYALLHSDITTRIISFESEELMDNLYGKKIGGEECKREVVFVDCRAYRSPECFKVMHDADIVVVNLRQDELFISNYVLKDMRMFPNAMILVGNCYADSEQEGVQIENKFRISNNSMGVLPANGELANAFDRQDVGGFMNREFGRTTSERNRRTLSEIARFAVKLDRQMEKIN